MPVAVDHSIAYTNIMNLETSINSAPLLRSWDLPDSARHV